jgi:excisionase family DNA binding protein
MSRPLHVNHTPNLATGLQTESFGQPRGLTRADLLTAAQVADLLDVPVSTVREWGRSGTLPRIKLGRHVRFLRSQVEATILSARDVGGT